MPRAIIDGFIDHHGQECLFEVYEVCSGTVLDWALYPLQPDGTKGPVIDAPELDDVIQDRYLDRLYDEAP